MTTIELKGLQGLHNLLNEDKKLGKNEQFFKVPLDNLSPGRYQPRKIIKEEEIQELAQSILSQGIIQPIIVRNGNVNNRYEIIAGERRWRAARLAGLSEVPVICRKINDQTALAFALIENVQRQSLNALEEAHSIRQLIDEFSISQEDVAKMLGKARPTISNLLRLLNLNTEVKLLLSDDLLELGHAKVLLGLEEKKQISVANIIIKNNLSVRETEKLIETMKKQSSKIIAKKDSIAHEKIHNWETVLSKKLHSKVNIQIDKNGRGRVVLNVESIDEIDWLVKNITILN